MSGPFYCYLHAPGFGELAQKLGAHCRFGTSIPPRLSEFAILVTAQLLEIAIRVGGARADRRASRASSRRPSAICGPAALPRRRPKDERAIYAFVEGALSRQARERPHLQERATRILGDAGTVELVGLLGYYAMVAMTLDVFRMPVPEGTPLPFAEPAVR